MNDNDKEFVQKVLNENNLYLAVRFIIAVPRMLFGDTSGTGLDEATEYAMSQLPKDKVWTVDALAEAVEKLEVEKHTPGGLENWWCDEDSPCEED